MIYRCAQCAGKNITVRTWADPNSPIDEHVFRDAAQDRDNVFCEDCAEHVDTLRTREAKP